MKRAFFFSGIGFFFAVIRDVIYDFLRAKVCSAVNTTVVVQRVLSVYF